MKINRKEKLRLFKIADSPLEGATLIEASAGTGKTFAITGIYLRLILEKDLTVDKILTVTFTEAAAGELRDRIRSRLIATVMMLAGRDDDASLDTRTRELVDKFRNDDLQRQLAAKYADDANVVSKLRNALRNFDEASIYTIHSFCRRVLLENAFESGSLFDTELAADQSDLVSQIADDFWRLHFYAAPVPFVEYALLVKKIGPKDLISIAKNRSLDPAFTVVPAKSQLGPAKMQKAAQGLTDCYKRVCAMWPEARDEACSFLVDAAESGVLKRNMYKPESIPLWLAEMDNYVASGCPLYPVGKIVKFTESGVMNALAKGKTIVIKSRIFQLMEKLNAEITSASAAFDEYIIGLQSDFLDFINDELCRRKRKINIRSFDDLIRDTHAALAGGASSGLARSVRAKYAAALIDEFQDTDPLQYTIFTTIFGGESILFLIGDPKQAIYGFRGADIFAYMKAAAGVASRGTLTVNWRSDARLIRAVNRMFGRPKNPFVFNEIEYHHVTASIGRDETDVGITAAPAPMRIWFIDREFRSMKSDYIGKGEAENLIADRVAVEISRLVSGGSADDGRVVPGDIAVLVRKKYQAAKVQEALKRFRVPAVLYGTESIFESREAVDVSRVMRAVADPSNGVLVRAALATDIFGYSGEKLINLDERDWETIFSNFFSYHELWARSGFMRMFRRMLAQEEVAVRALSYPDGERVMTNMLHCAELLHAVEIENKTGMDGLIKWLDARRALPGESDEYQIRLETDENAVKIITMHRSKGLEFPVVFCPFLWEGSEVKKKGKFLYHDAGHDNRPVLDLGSGDEAGISAGEREQLAENVRLMYVALTRAKRICYLVWGKINETETSAPAYIFHAPQADEALPSVEELKNSVSLMTYDAMLNDLRRLADDSEGAISLHMMPSGEGFVYAPHAGEKQDAAFRQFKGAIRRDWRITSYSSFISGGSGEKPARDVDAWFGTYSAAPARVSGSFFDFPRGSLAGQCIHEIFEKLDFTADVDHDSVIRDSLKKYGYGDEWRPAVRSMAAHVLAAPLDAARPGLMLKSIPACGRLNELEFYFPLNALVDPSGMADVFARHGAAGFMADFAGSLRGLGFMPVRGFVRGYIDMVFEYHGKYYLVDWKTNHLGNDYDDYTAERINDAMFGHYYILQYHLYTVALHRYLSLRIPGYRYETHFGGVYYLFVRGVNSTHGAGGGIYRDVPSAALVRSLSDYLHGEGRR